MSLQKCAKILFIDDNKEITKSIGKFLELKNYDVTIANDGKSGISLILNQKFDVVLLDISMPGVSGFDIIDTLAKQGRIKDQKIILLTAVDMSKDEIEGLLELGVHSCMLKPVDMDTLFEVLETARNSPTNKK